MTHTLRTLTIASLACLLLAGCRVSENHQGGNKNVDIGTPFGSMQVETNNSSDTAAIGLAAYPGAVPVARDADGESNSANVNMNFGSFHLGVKAASFQTPDSQDKVIAFYRKDLAARYGDVIECRADHPVDTPTRTSQGLTCNNTRDNHYVQLGSELNDDNIELRAGSEQLQHIVDVEAHDGGTKIGLVALGLPSHLSGHNGKDIE